MAYDFKRNYTNTLNNGTVTSATVTTGLRTLHGFFDRSSRPARAHSALSSRVRSDSTTSASHQNAPAGFVNSVGLSDGATYFALYPAAGIEAFAGPIGIRLEIGDDIYFNNGAHNNLRASIGPQFRF